ncbi:MAG TPA: single-stranded DNA-binding protein [Elusimicrobiota bacterium]|nr:single-stranded DNA-binding protein [Elusimicrobiota bacterium]
MTSTTLRLVQLNDVRLVGRLTRDPEVRYTPKGQAVARLDMAVNRRYKDASGEWREEATFVPVTVWRETAERCRERLKKGSPIYVEGRLRSTSWETKDGQKRSGLEVEAFRLQFLAKSGGEESGEPPEAAAAEAEPAAPAAPAAAVPEPVAAANPSAGDDEIPF